MLSQAIGIFRSLPALIQKTIGVSVLFLLLIIIAKNCGNKYNWSYVSALEVRVPKVFEIHGLDISHHNGDINWQLIRDFDEENIQLKFVFIKASEGVSLADKHFKKNWKAAQKHGLLRGAYHYYIPWRDPESQFALFKKQVGPQYGELPPVLDIEENSLRPDSRIIKEIGIWLRLAHNYYGKKPIIYTNRNFYNKFIKGNYENYPLWIAEYTAKDLAYYPETSLQFWQYSKNAKIEGIEEKLDVNVYTRSEEEFEKFLK